MKIIGMMLMAMAIPLNAMAFDVTLAWDANVEPVSGYRIYHSNNCYNSFSIVSPDIVETTWKHENLAHGSHCWVATAFDASDESGYSNCVCRRISLGNTSKDRARIRGVK